jgi:hypothetical protein
MKRFRCAVSAFTVMTLLGLAAPAGAGEVMKHSGRITSISDGAGTFVLAEVGPWRVRDGATVITNRTITLVPETRYAVVARADAAPSGYAGDFVETSVGPEKVYLGDSVTVECLHEGTRLVALKITVTDMPAGGGESSR